MRKINFVSMGALIGVLLAACGPTQADLATTETQIAAVQAATLTAAAPTATSTFTATSTHTPTFTPTLTPTFTPTFTPTLTDTPTASATPADTPAPKPTRVPTNTEAPAPIAATTADAIAGTWSGVINFTNSEFHLTGAFQTTLTINKSCTVGSVCGSLNAPAPAIPCTGTLILIGIEGNTYQFQASNVQGACIAGDINVLQLLSNGTLLYSSRSGYSEGTGVFAKTGG